MQYTSEIGNQDPREARRALRISKHDFTCRSSPEIGIHQVVLPSNARNLPVAHQEHHGPLVRQTRLHRDGRLSLPTRPLGVRKVHEDDQIIVMRGHRSILNGLERTWSEVVLSQPLTHLLSHP